MPWTDDYTGIPFKCDGKDRNGSDCWGLIALVYKERRGIELPLYKGVFADQSEACLREVAAVMKREKEKWQKIADPQLYDVIMLRTGAYSWHVGLVVSRKEMLHVMEGIESVVEEFTGRQWKDRIEGIYRYAG